MTAASSAPSATDPAARASFRQGVLSSLGAFLLWGIAVLYFKLVGETSVMEVMAHRIIWSLVFCGIILTFARRWRAVAQALSTWRNRLTFLASTVVISVNWGVFIGAIVDGHVIQASLGYYINPLLNVALGVVVLRERLTVLQGVAVAIAAAGVVNQAFALGQMPWIALFLGGSFAVYGLIRKTAQVDSLVGLTLETGLLTPFALGYLVWLGLHGGLDLGTRGLANDLLLLGLGPLTAIPLLLFAHGARRIPLSLLGFIQYCAPTIQFLIALFLFREPFGGAQFATFALIWTALAVYSFDAWQRRSR